MEALALCVRGYNGQSSRWYRAAVRYEAGRIVAAGMTKEVAFEPVDGPVNDRIDDAYRAKYRASRTSARGRRPQSSRAKEARTSRPIAARFHMRHPHRDPRADLRRRNN
jgi:hypothetical protein